MNPPTPSNTKTFIADLMAAVDRIPAERFTCLEISDSPDVTLSEVEALKGITDLGSLAEMGEPEALTALVRIGNQVTEILERIAAGKNRSPVHFPSATHSHAEGIVREDYSIPPIHVAYQGDLGEVEAVLDKWRSQIEEDFKGRKGGQYWVPKLSRRRIRVTVGQFLCSEDFTFTHHLPVHDSELNVSARRKWDDLAIEDKWERLRQANATLQIPSPQEKASMAISEIVDTVVGNRIHHLFRVIAQQTLLSVAKASFMWPTRVSALPYQNFKLDELPGFLALGAGLPFRLQRDVHQPGRPAPLDPDSAAGFALIVCYAIFEIQQRFPDLPADDGKGAKELSEKLEALIAKSKKPARRGEMPVDFNEKHSIELGGVKYSFSVQDRWKLNALLLPAFPEVGKAPNDTRFTLWKQVALQYAEWLCDGNWGDYDWPKCVTVIVAKNSSETKIRKHREVVSTQLTDGLKVLRSV